MLLCLQRYNLVIAYKKGTLSRAQLYPKDTLPHSTLQSELCHAIEELTLTEQLATSKERLLQMCETTVQHPNLTANAGGSTCWPHKSCVPVEAKLYLKCNDELSVQNGLLVKRASESSYQQLLQKITQQSHGSGVLPPCVQSLRSVLMHGYS